MSIRHNKFSTYSTNIIFIVLMLLGLTFVSKLSLQLNPSSRSDHLSVSFSWPGANPEMLEMEVTTKLEGAYARTKGLKDIYSTTYPGYGYISMEIDKSENIDAIKLYLSSITRSLEKEFPEGVSIGTVNGGYYNNAVIADPLFADPFNGDFTLAENSPAWDIGFEPIDMSDVGPRK